MSMKKLTLAMMFLTATVLVPAARAAEKGQISFDLAAAPEPHHEAFGMRPIQLFPRVSYQLSDRVSIHPLLSLAHSGLTGWSYGLGAEATYRFRPKKSWSPYLGAGVGFNHRGRDSYRDPLLGTSTLLSQPLGARNYATFSAAAGLEYTISRRFGLFTELRATHRTGGQLGFDGTAWRPERGLELTPIIGFRLKAR
jgi:hypothetical protein